MTKIELQVKIGEFVLDIAKLIIAGVVLSTIFDDLMTKWNALLLGLIATATFTGMGIIILYKSVKK